MSTFVAVDSLLPHASAYARSITSTCSPRNAEAATLSRTVLLVEDDEHVRTVLSRALNGAGFIVLTARNGVEAVEIADAHQGVIDLLLTDLVMPRMSGHELSRVLLTARPELPVLFISGWEQAIAMTVLSARQALLMKPFTLADLTVQIESLLRSKPPDEA